MGSGRGGAAAEGEGEGEEARLARLVLLDCGFAAAELDELVAPAGPRAELPAPAEVGPWLQSLAFPTPDALRYAGAAVAQAVSGEKLLSWAADARRGGAKLSESLGMSDPLHQRHLRLALALHARVSGWFATPEAAASPEGLLLALQQVRRALLAEHETMIAAFRAFDSDKDGAVERTELVRGMQHLGVTLDAATSRALLHLADTDASGRVEFNEFKKLFLDLDSPTKLAELRAALPHVAGAPHGDDGEPRASEFPVGSQRFWLDFQARPAPAARACVRSAAGRAC